MEPTWHDGLSRKALVELVEALLMAVDKAVPRLDAIAHHLSLIAQQGEEHEVAGRRSATRWPTSATSSTPPATARSCASGATRSTRPTRRTEPER